MSVTQRLILLLCLCILYTGCTSFASLGDTLNERQVQSCVYTQGAAGLFVQVRSVSATGGIPLETCLREGR